MENKENKYYISYENYLHRFDYVNKTIETWRIDEHTFDCIYEKQEVDDVEESFRILSEECKIPFKEISKEVFNFHLNLFNFLQGKEEEINNMKRLYAYKVKEYIDSFNIN